MRNKYYKQRYPFQLVEPSMKNISDYRNKLPFGRTSRGIPIIDVKVMKGKSVHWLKGTFIKGVIDKVKYLIYTIGLLQKFAHKYVLETKRLKRVITKKGYMTKHEARLYADAYYKRKMAARPRQPSYLNSIRSYAIFEAYRKQTKFTVPQATLMIILSQYQWFELSKDCKKWGLTYQSVRTTLTLFEGIGYVEIVSKKGKYNTVKLTPTGKAYITKYKNFYERKLRQFEPIIESPKVNNDLWIDMKVQHDTSLRKHA